jgi:ribosomal protein S18 acetylase RimI-like enzyme
MASDWVTLFDRMEIWALDGATGLMASLALEPGPGFVTIWSVAVAPASQGTGLGARLLDFAEARARALGCTEIRLFTNALMARNIQLYTARGYRETRREATPAWTAVHMAKAV